MIAYGPTKGQQFGLMLNGVFAVGTALKTRESVNRERLSLALLMTGVGLADDAENAVAADDHAMFTDTFNGRTNFHGEPPVPIC